MAQPDISRQYIKVEGNKLRSTVVEFPNAKRTVLILDYKFNLEESVDETTFTNLCYEVCKAEKRSVKFVYVETIGLTGDGLKELIEKVDPYGVVYVDDNPAKRYSTMLKMHFSFLQNINGRYQILSTPFHKWANKSGFVKGEAGQNLVGFNLKHMLYATRGKNPYTPPQQGLVENYRLRIIKTIADFDKFMERITKHKVVAIDTEGSGLARTTTTLYTVQFGVLVAGKPIVWVLPWEHKEEIWTEKQLRYIKKRMHEYFMTTKSELLFHYGIYDIGQLCYHLGIDLFLPRVSDTQAFQFANDENHKFFSKFYGMKGGYSLGGMESRHGLTRPNDILDKDDRKNMARFSLDEIARYGAVDVITPLLLRECYLEQCTDKFIGYKSQEDYLNVVINQLGVMIKVFAMLHNNGMFLNVDKIIELTKPTSIFNVEIAAIKKKLLQTKAGAKANRIILKKKGIDPAGGMFATASAEAFELTKPSHLKILFFDVLGLEAIRQGKSGEGSTDKAFQKKYAHIPEVAMFSQFNKIKTLKSNFADSIFKRIQTDPDFKKDGRIRPTFGFTPVLTGRGSCTDPNLQNIPVRSDLAKHIKEEFMVQSGRVMVGSDFSAHEVRVAGIVSQDEMVMKTFMIANEAIRKYRLAKKDLLEAAAVVLAREGDVHIINVRFFFKQDVDKKHPLRNNIKAVVFGVIYGKLAKALGKELGITEAEAQALIDVLFERWGSMKAWMDKQIADGGKNFLIHYPNMRIRHLWGYLSDDIWVRRAMDRRGVNSVVQGFAADIGHTALHEYALWKYKNITSRGYELDAMGINIVHDAQYSDVLFEHLPLAVYLTEHSMSTLPMDYYKKKFNFEINTPLGYGLELGTNWAKMKEWDYRPESMLTMVRDLGKGMDKKAEAVEKVVDDMKYMLKIRHSELRDDPYKMKIGHNSVGQLFEDLHMFRDQEAA